MNETPPSTAQLIFFILPCVYTISAHVFTHPHDLTFPGHPLTDKHNKPDGEHDVPSKKNKNCNILLNQIKR